MKGAIPPRFRILSAHLRFLGNHTVITIGKIKGSACITPLGTPGKNPNHSLDERPSPSRRTAGTQKLMSISTCLSLFKGSVLGSM